MAKATTKKAPKSAKPASGGKTRTKEEYRSDPNYFECKHCGHFVLKSKKDRHFDKHPECKSQEPKTAAKKAAGKPAKAAKKPAAKSKKTKAVKAPAQVAG